MNYLDKCGCLGQPAVHFGGARFVFFILLGSVWILLVGCGSAAQTRDDPALGDRRQTLISQVEIVGNHNLTDSSILQGLVNRGPVGLIFKDYTPYDPIALATDKKRIVSFYQRQGYLSAKVLAMQATPSGPGKTKIRIEVEEGPVARIEQIKIDGITSLDSEQRNELFDTLLIERGQIFIHQEYLDEKQRLKDALIALGYAFASVAGRVEVNPGRTKVSIRLHAVPGLPVRFGQTTVRGFTWVNATTIRNRIAWSQGQAFDPALIDITRNRLYKLGVFSNVRIAYDGENQPDVADMNLLVAENTRNELRAGFGIGADSDNNELRGRVDYTRRGFLTPDTNLHLGARPAYVFRPAMGLEGEALVGVEHHDFFYPLLRLDSEFAYSAQEQEAYSLKGLRLSTSLDRSFLGDRLMIALGWRFRLQDFGSIHSAISDSDRQTLGLGGTYRLGYFEQNLSVDLRDNPLEAKRGFFAEIRFEQGGGFAAGAFEYIRINPDFRFYLPLGSRLTTAVRAEFGQFLHREGPLPITQRFFAGGASSQRGFSQQRLAPFIKGADGSRVPIGGESLVQLGLEIRLDLFRLWGNWFGIVGFVDGADVSAKLNQMDIGNLHWAVGAGIRLRTLVGPIRLDFGLRLNRWKEETEPDPGEQFAIHFSLGEAF